MAISAEEVWALFRETDRKFQETAQQQKETERLIQENAEQMKDTDQRLRVTAERLQDLDALVTRVSKQVGDLGNRLGEFVEHMVAPAVVRLFQAQGLDVHEVHPNIEIKRHGIALEIDLLVVNEGTMVCVECKSKLTMAHVDQHLARLAKLKQVMPAYRHHRAMGAVAAMVVPDAVAQHAMAQGLYVLSQNGEHIEVRNPVSFAAAIW